MSYKMADLTITSDSVLATTTLTFAYSSITTSAPSVYSYNNSQLWIFDSGASDYMRQVLRTFLHLISHVQVSKKLELPICYYHPYLGKVQFNTLLL